MFPRSNNSKDHTVHLKLSACLGVCLKLFCIQAWMDISFLSCLEFVFPAQESQQPLVLRNAGWNLGGLTCSSALSPSVTPVFPMIPSGSPSVIWHLAGEKRRSRRRHSERYGQRETVSLTSEVLDKNPLSLCSGKTYPKVKFESNSLFLNQCYSKCIQELCWIRFPLSANVLVFKLEWKAMMTDRIFNTL